MSRINDALKRASRVHRPPRPSGFKTRPTSPGSSSSMAANAATRSTLLRVAIVGAALVVLAFGGWAAREWHEMTRRLSEITDQDRQLVIKREVPILSTATASAPPLESLPSAENAPAAAPPLELPTTVEVQVFPALKLQGVFFSRKNPSVLINGKNRSLGETIEGVRIIKIEQQKVTVEWNGETKTLSIGS